MLSMDLVIHHIFRFFARYEVENLLFFYPGIYSMRKYMFWTQFVSEINVPLFLFRVNHGAARMNIYSFVYFFNTWWN